LGGTVQGTGIRRVNGNSSDLIGFVQNVVGLNPNSSAFEYVSPQIAPIG